MMNTKITKSLTGLVAALPLILSLCLAVLFLSGCEYAYTGSGYQIIEENPNAEPWFNVYRPTDMTQVIEDKGHLLPVIVWANGGCFRSEFTWQPLFKRWAAEGYVVLALAETPNGGALVQTSVADHGALIDWALNQSPYADMLDANRVVAAGNSCGGVTALGLAAQDERVAMVFVLSGSSAVGFTSQSVMENITVPVGYVIGSETDIASGPAQSDYAALAQGIPAMIVNRSEGGHVNVSTTVSILEEVASIAYHWMEWVLYGEEASYQALTSENVCPDCTPGDWTLNAKHLDTLAP